MLDEGEVFYDVEEVQEFWLDKEDFSTQYLILPVVDLDVFDGDCLDRRLKAQRKSKALSCPTNAEDIIPEVAELEIE